MEVGCLRQPGASTIGSQLLDGDRSHGWQIQATQPWTPMQKEKKTGIRRTDETVERKGETGGGDNLQGFPTLEKNAKKNSE